MTGRRLFILGNSFSKPIPLNPFPFLYIPQFSRFTLLVYLTLSQQHEFFEEASAAGLVYGLTMPLHGARGELGALSLSVEAENRAEANRFMESVLPTLWMLKDYALQSGAGLAFEHPVSKPVVLTSREKEVLQWCAIGKTSWEISVICNCSEANVNFHMGNIRRKFGVTSRRVAAIMAVNLGLITL